MLIWKNTSILDSCVEDLSFTEEKNKAEIVLMGSQSIELEEFSSLKAIFRAGIGRDNVPEKEAEAKNIVVRYPSKETSGIIYEETASFTCGLIFRMLYGNVGNLDSWVKKPRDQFLKKTLLVIGTGEVGSRVVKAMKYFLNVTTFDILKDEVSDLQPLMTSADCVTIHIPKSDENISFMDSKKLSWMKNDAILVNTARGAIVDEDALYKEIKSERLKAAFDVYWKEPYRGKLMEFYPHRFFMTPHVASNCMEFSIACRKNLDKLITELVFI